MNAWTVVKRNPVVCALALLAAVALIFVSEGTYWQSLATLEHLALGQQERAKVRDLHIGMLEAETAQRGYLLTGNKAYLQPYANGLKSVKESLDELDRSYPTEPQTQPVLAALRGAVAAKQAEMAQTLRLHDEGQTAAALALIASDVGMTQMQAILSLTTELLAQDNRVRAAHRADLQATLALSRIGVASLSLLGLLALALYLRHNLALQAHQLELKRLAQLERERLEVEVQQRTAELTDLTRHLLTAREDERNRLARDLHDELGALLTSAKLDAARIRSRLGDTAPEAQERLAHLVATLNTSIALGRRIIEDLRPSTLANLGLVAALEILAREFGERSGVQVHCALAPVKLSPPAELVVYRLVQEAITNLSKHAKASQVWISLREHDGRVEASVRDNGVGFQTAKPPASAYGLLGMRYRVEAERGRLAVVSAPRQGTTVSLSLPISG
jgi:signal transduction histidine kinase